MDDSASTATLVHAARAGSQAAMAALYQRFAPVVHGVLLARLQPADADDLTQDVFETALQRLHTLHEPAAFPGWIISIARRAAVEGRRRAPRTVAGAAESLADLSATPEQRLEAGRVLAAIQALPAAYRETLLLRLAEGLNGPEIAERTGLSHGSVRVNLHRGMSLLRAALSIPVEGGHR
ncbi:RNA polymerase sigma factor [Pseudoxanthomonas indica]|uniref:RNA polymerase sigma-70 factor, ECF subfamily n=1 Tax=Pseudoxanthomonas indica TaxID=428993 RepID=A0A1T5JVR4_9GAMM|nr:sigma-70 family RNA polymerase sigma factor [Pseudoxanthomonas indica]GGD44707.1 RNA polymerase sigma factor [Pseudoxanthomonas indica]SKC55513.1 RNA polymerase sigma-70 factor, ECF subfamily [Pseudoxanthomonas indica]